MEHFNKPEKVAISTKRKSSNKLVKIALCSSALLLSSQAYAGTKYQVSHSELPRASEVVDQTRYKEMLSYKSEGASGSWWLCGHAAFATAMNILRTQNANAPNQLEYFHVKLKNRNSSYASPKTSPYRQASGDDLKAIVDTRGDFKVKKITNLSRDKAKKDLIAELLDNNEQQVVVLTKRHGFGHFVVLHEIYSDTTTPDSGGGYVRFADPYKAVASAKMGYTDFLNGMRDAGTSGQYSFWVIEKE